MNESMNFGNIGFGNVSNNNNNAPEIKNENNDNNVENTTELPSVETKAENGQIDLMAGVKEAKEAEEKKKLEEEQAIQDFKKAHAKKSNMERDADNFSQIDFGPLKRYLDDDDITDISYSNNGQLWLKSLEKGVYRADQQDVDNELIEKIAFQCSNIMGKTFNMAHPFLDSESAELRMNFVHESIARNGIAVVFRKTPAKIRLEKQKLLNEKYVRLSIHDFLINCVKGHCNIIICGETGSGKTELVKYLASHTAENEKLITIEDTLELHLDRIFPHRDIVAMKTNNIASYSDVLVTCMRQNPIWILLSEVRSAEAVTAVRNSISSGHYILSTIHADKAESIPHRMYSLLESNIDVEQFLKTIYRYVQIGVFVRGRYKPEEKRFVREIAGVCEFFVTDDTNEPKFNNIYLKTVGGEETYQEPTKYIKNYLEGQGVDVTNLFGEKLSSLAEANQANGIESDVKELDGEVIHIPGKENVNANSTENNIMTDNPVDNNQQQVDIQEKPAISLQELTGNNSTSQEINNNENVSSSVNEQITQPVQDVVSQPNQILQPTQNVVPQANQILQPVQDVVPQPNQILQPVQDVMPQPSQILQPVQDVVPQDNQINVSPTQITQKQSNMNQQVDNQISNNILQPTMGANNNIIMGESQNIQPNIIQNVGGNVSQSNVQSLPNQTIPQNNDMQATSVPQSKFFAGLM